MRRRQVEPPPGRFFYLGKWLSEPEYRAAIAARDARRARLLRRIEEDE
ncbi:hypothetical protein KST_05028 [Mycobacterium marinum]|nr:hypothetical protein KST_05028 [Mycobacterium marinum]